MGLLDLLSEPLREPAGCIVKVDDEEITDLYPFLVEVTVECSRTKWCEATLRFESGRDELGNWSVQDDEVFVPWKTVSIEAAFGDHTEDIVTGYIRQVDAKYPEDQGSAAVTVFCRDASLKLDREHVRVIWGTEEEPISDTQVLEQIVVDRHDLALHDDNGAGQEGLVQQNQDSTDIAFLQKRAEANGYELLFEDDTLYFGPMRIDAEPQATILVYAGPSTNCLSFSVTDDGHKPDKVAFEVAAPEGTEVVEQVVEPDLDLMGKIAASSMSAGLDDFAWRLSREGTRSEEELLAVAQRKANEFSMKIRAEGELDGSMYGHVLRVGHPVGVDGIGTWLGGVYYVDTLTHKFNLDGYRQAFTLLRNAHGDNL